MYVYCVESFAHFECYSDCSRMGETLWLNPFATVLFIVCSALTVECCILYPCCMFFWYFLLRAVLNMLVRKLIIVTLIMYA